MSKKTDITKEWLLSRAHMEEGLEIGAGAPDSEPSVLIELIETCERALAIRSPNVKWTKAETERSWAAWEEQARAAIARAKGGQ